MFNNLTLRTKIIAGSCLPLILIAILGFMSISSIKSLLQSNEWVGHTHEVIAHANSIVASVVDMETGARGYLLAGKEGFLAPYTDGNISFRERSLLSKIQSMIILSKSSYLTISKTRLTSGRRMPLIQPLKCGGPSAMPKR